ncbi:response regulator [Planktothrix sp. FACHB-1355]|uniref:Response regulator n=1 Tax=Aerosakkonema funiforme FACHB-1375 TaxID=2949571 RepID=A0A926ZJV1_9CYAN|nr:MULTISPECIES: response regulator [Oscillatoriales]MBD2185049.1 response regulator [Aerosakkonema funiforme FACHB-1375]MBD3558074.1 response regulator [Planktothrix sp. FACHB-1355]
MPLILMIDDAAFTRRMLRKALTAEGYEVLEATNGQEGLEMAAIHKPDCILVDLLMPDIDGFGVLQAMRDRRSTIPVIVVSADIQVGVRQRCMELGAAGFLNKPPKQEELRQKITQALGYTQEMAQ